MNVDLLDRMSDKLGHGRADLPGITGRVMGSSSHHEVAYWQQGWVRVGVGMWHDLGSTV